MRKLKLPALAVFLAGMFGGIIVPVDAAAPTPQFTEWRVPNTGMMGDHHIQVTYLCEVMPSGYFNVCLDTYPALNSWVQLRTEVMKGLGSGLGSSGNLAEPPVQQMRGNIVEIQQLKVNEGWLLNGDPLPQGYPSAPDNPIFACTKPLSIHDWDGLMIDLATHRYGGSPTTRTSLLFGEATNAVYSPAYPEAHEVPGFQWSHPDADPRSFKKLDRHAIYIKWFK